MPNCTVAVLALLFSLLLSTPLPSQAFISSIEESEVEANGNPHQRRVSTGGGSASKKECINNDSSMIETCEPRTLLRPHYIIRQLMPTQPDTFLGIVRRKILSVPVPVYQFKQPSRVSQLELPFELVLVSDVDAASAATLRDVPLDPKMALDSWFPGYSWTPVVCNECGEYIHVGWRFTSTTNPSEYFYALIVDTKRKGKEQVAAGIIAEKEGIMSGVVSDIMEIGTVAPGWMIAALSKVAS